MRIPQHLALAFGLAWPRLTARGRGAAVRRAILYLLFAVFAMVGLAWCGSLIGEFFVWRAPIRLAVYENVFVVEIETGPVPPMAVKLWYQYDPGSPGFPPPFYSIRQFGVVVVMPFWILLAGSGAIALLAFRLVVRRARVPQRCDHCAYPLMGTLNPRGGGRCPECGRRQRSNGGVRTLLRMLWRLVRFTTRRAIEIGKALVGYDAPFPDDPPAR